jgi:hypothetical protein
MTPLLVQVDPCLPTLLLGLQLLYQNGFYILVVLLIPLSIETGARGRIFGLS